MSEWRLESLEDVNFLVACNFIVVAILPTHRAFALTSPIFRAGAMLTRVPRKKRAQAASESEKKRRRIQRQGRNPSQR